MTARHTTTLRRFATVALASAIASTMLAGTATAEIDTFKDARGDLDHGADLHRVRVVNEKDVRVRVVHDDLRRSWRSGSSLALFLDTDRTRKGPEFVFLGGTFEGSDYALLPAKGWKRAGDRQVPLHGGSYEMKLDYAKDTAIIRFDREVLGKPGAVRVEVKTAGQMVSTGDAPAPTSRDWLGRPRHFSPWVARG
jgi:hypothetical protein